MKRALIAFAVFGLALNSFAAAQTGKAAPEFTGIDIEGKPHRLSDYQGKIVILESFNPDCPYVKNHYQSGAMPELQHEITEKGAVWLVVNSISKDSKSYRTPEKAKAEAAKMKATALLDDNSGEIGKAYGMRTTPHMFVIDKQGVLAYQGAIDDHASPEGDPRKARNYVRDAVEKLNAGEKVAPAETKPYGCGVKYK